MGKIPSTLNNVCGFIFVSTCSRLKYALTLNRLKKKILKYVKAILLFVETHTYSYCYKHCLFLTYIMAKICFLSSLRKTHSVFNIFIDPQINNQTAFIIIDDWKCLTFGR